MAEALLAEAAALAALIGPIRLARTGRPGAGPGEHARGAAGSGAEFWQYRPLQPGEAATRIDWRRSARSDLLYERQREEARPARLLVWADASGSMDFASARGLPAKRDHARLLVLALALAARAGGEQVGVAGAAPAAGPEALAAMLAAGAQGPWPDEAGLRAGDTLLAAGDWLGADVAARSRALAARGVRGVLLHVIDPAEADFPFAGALRFEPAEAGEAALELAEAGAARDAYLAAWAGHCAGVARAGEAAGWSALPARTDSPPAGILRQAAERLRG
jgi:uncharacterized protein (DUF58 family)